MVVFIFKVMEFTQNSKRLKTYKFPVASISLFVFLEYLF